MNAITIVAAVFVLSVAIVPPLAELARIVADRHNPIRGLRVPTRRGQVLDPSQSFA